MMSFEELLTSLWCHESHNIVCFPGTFPLLTSSSLFVSFALSRTKNPQKFITSPQNVSSKLALESIDYCAAFIQSR